MCTNSAKQPASKKNRRQNESVKISDLASFIPLSTIPASSSSVATSSANKPPTIAVLRLTSTFLKLHKFVKDSKSFHVSMYAPNCAIVAN